MTATHGLLAERTPLGCKKEGAASFYSMEA
jgi:hypothetical protein